MSATLIAHCGSGLITREELEHIPPPDGTSSHRPIAHGEIARVFQRQLEYRKLWVEKEEYAISANQMKMFGVMEVRNGHGEYRFAVAFRHGNDTSLALSAVAGVRVVICDNLMLKGDFKVIAKKHTKNFNLEDAVCLAIDKVQKSFPELENQIRDWQNTPVEDDEARLFLYRCFVEAKFPSRILPDVHEQYFQGEKTLWALNNCVTGNLQALSPIKEIEWSAKFGTYFSNYWDVPPDPNLRLLS